MSIVLLLTRVGLSLIFCAAGFAKLANLAGSRQASRDFGGQCAFGALLPLADCCHCLWQASATIWRVERTLAWYPKVYHDHQEQGILLSPKNTP